MAECGGLENRYPRKGIEGSNPSLSARKSKPPKPGGFIFCALRDAKDSKQVERRPLGGKTSRTASASETGGPAQRMTGCYERSRRILHGF